MKNEQNFVNWLMVNRGKDKKQSRDLVSRCRRIERVFNLDLDSVIDSNKRFDELLGRIEKEASSYLKPNSSIWAYAQLKTAARVYREFKNFKQN